MNLCPSIVQRVRRDTPPTITAPYREHEGATHRALSDTRERYFDQSRRTRSGVVAEFHPKSR